MSQKTIVRSSGCWAILHFDRCWLLLFAFCLFFLGMAANPAMAQEMVSDSVEVAEESIALEKYVLQALENNPQLRALFSQYYARLEQIPQAGALPDPEVMLQYHLNPMSYSPPLSRTAISAMQMFPWFGTLGKRKEYVAKMAELEWTTFQQARNQMVLQVKRQWYRMKELHHHIMVFGRHLELSKKLEQQVRAQYESGRVSQVELLRIQIEQERLETRIKNAEGELGVMKTRFNALLNRNPEAVVRFPGNMTGFTLEQEDADLRRSIILNNPELTNAEIEEEAAKVAVEQARLEGLPSFGLGLMVMNRSFMYMSLMEDDQAAWSASLTIRVPLNRSKYRSQQEEAHLLARAAQEKQQAVYNRLMVDVAEALQQYREARREITLYEERLIPKILQALDIALDEYSAGRSDFEQVIQLQQQLLDYEMQLQTAYANQNIATAEVEYLSGKYNVNPEEIDTKY